MEAAIEKSLSKTDNALFCQVVFTNYSDVVPDHIDPRGMGGSWRDDHPENIQAVHFWCNCERYPRGSISDRRSAFVRDLTDY